MSGRDRPKILLDFTEHGEVIMVCVPGGHNSADPSRAAPPGWTKHVRILPPRIPVT